MDQDILRFIDDQDDLIFIDDIKLHIVSFIGMDLRIDVEIQIQTDDIIFPFDRVSIKQDVLVLDEQVLDLLGRNEFIKKLLDRLYEQGVYIDM